MARHEHGPVNRVARYRPDEFDGLLKSPPPVPVYGLLKAHCGANRINPLPPSGPCRCQECWPPHSRCPRALASESRFATGDSNEPRASRLLLTLRLSLCPLGLLAVCRHRTTHTTVAPAHGSPATSSTPFTATIRLLLQFVLVAAGVPDLHGAAEARTAEHLHGEPRRSTEAVVLTGCPRHAGHAVLSGRPDGPWAVPWADCQARPGRHGGPLRHDALSGWHGPMAIYSHRDTTWLVPAVYVCSSWSCENPSSYCLKCMCENPSSYCLKCMSAGDGDWSRRHSSI